MTRKQLLALIPTDAVRVKVKTVKGRAKYRTIAPLKGDFDEVLPTDEVLLHKGKTITMRKVPGRKPVTPTVTPTTPHNAQQQELKKQMLAKDKLIRKLDKKIKEEPDSVVLLVMRGLAQEVASLEFERHQAEAEGRDTSQLSHRRASALKTIAENYSQFPEETGKVYRAQISALQTKLVHVENALDLLRVEMEQGRQPTEIVINKMWEDIIRSLLDEIRVAS
jgi:hypothetical protein